MHVVRRHVVRDIDQRGLGTNPQHDSLHRTDVMVSGTEVGQQGNNRSGHPGETCASWRQGNARFLRLSRDCEGFLNSISYARVASRKVSTTASSPNISITSRLVSTCDCRAGPA